MSRQAEFHIDTDTGELVVSTPTANGAGSEIVLRIALDTLPTPLPPQPSLPTPE